MGLPQFSGYDTTIVDKLTELIAKTNDMILKQNESIATTNTQTNDLLNKLNENIQAVNNNGQLYSQSSDIVAIESSILTEVDVSFTAKGSAIRSPANGQIKVLTEGSVRVFFDIKANMNPATSDFYAYPVVWVNGTTTYQGALKSAMGSSASTQWFYNVSVDVNVKKGDILEIGLKGYTPYTTDYTMFAKLKAFKVALTTISSPGSAIEI